MAPVIRSQGSMGASWTASVPMVSDAKIRWSAPVKTSPVSRPRGSVVGRMDVATQTPIAMEQTSVRLGSVARSLRSSSAGMKGTARPERSVRASSPVHVESLTASLGSATAPCPGCAVSRTPSAEKGRSAWSHDASPSRRPGAVLVIRTAPTARSAQAPICVPATAPPASFHPRLGPALTPRMRVASAGATAHSHPCVSRVRRASRPPEETCATWMPTAGSGASA